MLVFSMKKGLFIFLSLCICIKGHTTSMKECPLLDGSLHNARICYRNLPDCTSNQWGGIAAASLLVWQAKEDSLEFAANNLLFQTQGLNLNGDNVYPDFDFRPGVKVNLGLYLPCDWDFSTNFIYYHTNSKTNVSQETSAFGFGLIPLWRHPANLPATPLRFANARSKWKMDFYTLDCELGYGMITTPYIDFRFHGGLKGCIIHQEYSINYQNGQTINDVNVLSGEVALKNDSRGIGPRLGLNTKWYLGADWFINSSSAVANILSQFDLRRNETDKALNTATNTEIVTDINFTEKIWRWNPLLEAILGIGWQKCFNSFSFQVEVNYEMQYFWDQNLMRKFTDTYNEALNVPVKGDLMLHGVNFQFRFEF